MRLQRVWEGTITGRADGTNSLQSKPFSDEVLQNVTRQTLGSAVLLKRSSNHLHHRFFAEWRIIRIASDQFFGCVV